MKYFTTKDNIEDEYYDECMVYNLAYFKEQLNEKVVEIELEEQERCPADECPMWCSKFEEFIDKGYNYISCGSNCDYYSPCNGKSGRCRYLKNSFKGTGRVFLLTRKGLKYREIE